MLFFGEHCLVRSVALFQCLINWYLFLLFFNRGGLFSSAAHQRSAGDENNDPEDEPGKTITVHMLEMRASKLEEQVRDLTESYKKALADSDTVRRRTQKFVEDAKIFGIQSFCRDLVEVADMLEKTTDSVSKEALGDQNPTLKNLYGELLLIQEQLHSVFGKHGLQKMTPIGGKYDPYQHEIVCHVAADGTEPGTVTVVTHEGYQLHGRTIRHAHVGVAVESQD
ncbi:grpE protein homolog 2, mitochondrial-like isoform X1 [Polyodon spathula]|uniref:grpE protein homolog 2, mitochondrial-like isoform X1 n=1 Tax=Polyodon spathula TaxID=7913 RepID=UPI001B7DE71D|nr:grpE protein homolog 2, mitochondrial-like isoform X1 [Polyodon spathula]